MAAIGKKVQNTTQMSKRTVNSLIIVLESDIGIFTVVGTRREIFLFLD